MTAAFNEDDDLPALHWATNKASMAAQATFLFWTRTRLAAAVVAATGGAVAWKVGHHGHIRIGAWIAVLAFAAALGAELMLAVRSPEKIWYEGRAAAESVKTLAWRYMTRGETFESDVADVDHKFVSDVKDVLHDLHELGALPNRENGDQITSRMREIRNLDFDGRRAIYLRDRIRQQETWYSNKASTNRRRAQTWTVVAVVLESAGLAGAVLKALGTIDVDILGICATAAASVTAWQQGKQHRNLATAYSVTSQELAAVASELEAISDEAKWPQFVAEAEEAISREHTLWRASRGVRIGRGAGQD